MGGKNNAVAGFQYASNKVFMVFGLEAFASRLL